MCLDIIWPMQSITFNDTNVNHLNLTFFHIFSFSLSIFWEGSLYFHPYSHLDSWNLDFLGLCSDFLFLFILFVQSLNRRSHWGYIFWDLQTPYQPI